MKTSRGTVAASAKFATAPYLAKNAIEVKAGFAGPARRALEFR
jgi:hypothetical protein